LSPKWTYDFEKATLLNCPQAPIEIEIETIKEVETIKVETQFEPAELGDGAIAGIAVARVVLMGLLAVVINLVVKEKDGKPMFSPKQPAQEMT
jgi:hypothetical protein